MIYTKMLCKACGKPLRHRVISNTRFCANPECLEYHGIPPIEIDRNYAASQIGLHKAMDEDSWNPENW